MLGRTISHYQVIEKLGSGGMGEIFKAQDSRLNRMVAIKVLSRRALADEDRRRRFIKEAQAASSLNHPNIITIYDILSDEDNEYMVMEYVSGKTLTETIPKGGLGVSKTLQYAVQIADALASAHSAGIVHRDLKPGNIMVTESGRVKILDFGLAKMTVATQLSEDTETIGGAPLTMEGSIIGTVSYMSPEQAEGKRVDARSDIFSFGVVLYEMLTGSKAFMADSAVSTLTAILRDEVRPISEFTTGVPPELEEVVQRALRKDPAKRWQSMESVHAMLAGMRQRYDSGVLYATQIVSPAKKSKRPAWVTAVFAFCLISSITAGLMLTKRSKTPPQAPPPVVSTPPPAVAEVRPPEAKAPETKAPDTKPAEPKKTESVAKPAPPKEYVLTNKGVIEMAEAKVSPALMMSMIRSSKTKFDLTVPEVIKLSKAGVPDDVIEVMRDPTAPPKAPPPPDPSAESKGPPPGRGGRKEERVFVDMGRNFPNGLPTGIPRVLTPEMVAPGKMMISGGMPISLMLMDDIPTEPQAGMPLHFRVDQELRIGPMIIVAKGATATGEVVTARPNGRPGRPAFKLTGVDASDGTKIKLRASPGRNSQRNEQDIEKPGYKYKEALAPAGTTYFGYIDGDQTVSMKK